MTTTIERSYPLIDPARPQREGVGRINTAFGMVDADMVEILQLLAALQDLVATKAAAASIGPAIASAIDALVAGAPAALDTLKEVADKLADNDDAVAAIMASLATKANAANVYSRATLDGLLAAKADRAVVEGHADQLAALGAGGATVITANTNAVAGGVYFAKTVGGAFAITLPPSPDNGNTVEVWRSGTNAVTINRNGKTIAGLAENLVIDEDKRIAILRYMDGDWRVTGRVFA